jgi:hypothetical protein
MSLCIWRDSLYPPRLKTVLSSGGNCHWDLWDGASSSTPTRLGRKLDLSGWTLGKDKRPLLRTHVRMVQSIQVLHFCLKITRVKLLVPFSISYGEICLMVNFVVHVQSK